MNNYKDLQLIDNVIKGLNIERLSEAYEIILSSKHMENILLKRGIHLVVCPISNAYTIANSQINSILTKNRIKQNHQSISSINNYVNEKDSNTVLPFDLMKYLQSEFIPYSITSLSPSRYTQNLTAIYKNLLDNNEYIFTCEHVKFIMI